MAEFLINLKTHTAQELIDDPMLYRGGDIVQVYKDGTCTEDPAPTREVAIIKVPGLPFSRAFQRIHYTAKTTGEFTLDKEKAREHALRIHENHPEMTKEEIITLLVERVEADKPTFRRRFRLRLNNWTRQQLRSIVTITQEQFSQIVEARE